MNVMNKVSKAVLTAGVVAGLSMSSAMATELKMAHFTSPKHHLQVNIWEPLAKDLAEATNGKLTMTIYPAGKLGAGPAEQYNRVIDGVADIVHGLPGYTSVLFPKTLLVELPGVPYSDEVATDALWDAMPLIKDEYRRVKPLALFTSASAVLMTKDKPIRTPEDLKGLKIRVPSASVGKAVAAWGGTQVSMPITEVYNALQTGVIDGVLVDGSVLNSFKIKEVVNYITTGVPSTTSAFFLLMNRDSYENLTDEEQAAVDKLTGRGLSIKSSESYQREAKEGIEDFSAMPGKTLIELTPEQRASFDKLSRPVIHQTVSDLKKRGIDAAPIVEALGKH